MAVYTLRDLWMKACEHDCISPESKFVVFSDSNPWIKKYNTLMLLMLRSQVKTGTVINTTEEN